MKTTVRTRITVAMVVCSGIAMIVLGRAIQIQVAGDPKLEQMANRQFKSKVLFRPRRGMIVDRQGEPLAVNVETQSLAVNPSKIQNKKTLAKLLARALDVPPEKLLERLKGRREFAWVKRHLSEDEIQRLKQWNLILPSGELAAGFWMVNESKRTYPHGDVARQILGSVNLDSEGIEGIELWKEEQLKGKIARASAIRDALGRPSFMDAVAARGAQDGAAVELTIDASLQFKVEQSLRQTLERTQARSGLVIVMDAISGEILALADQAKSGSRNRAVTDAYEPGSTLKPLLLAIGLNHGMKLTDQVFGEHGSFTVQGKTISEAETHEKYEWMSLKKMIQVSSNVGSAKLALKLGPDRFLEGLKALGFEQKTGIGFPGEINGRIPGRKNWSPLTTANIGFGQGLLVTHLQMARAYGALINGGWLVQPTLIPQSPNQAGASRSIRVLPEAVTLQTLEALETVTQAPGTGIQAVLPGYRIAGKTGTAQVVDPGTKRYSRTRYNATFVGFPVGVRQKLVILTTLDEPRGVYYASTTAAPLFREVLGAVVNRLGIPATETLPVLAKTESSPLKDDLRRSLAKTIEVQDNRPQMGADFTLKMPNLIGMTSREALRALEGHRFKLEVSGLGLVEKQSPSEGQSLREDSVVRLEFSDHESQRPAVDF